MSNVKTDYVDYALKPVGSGNPVSLRKFETYNATTGALASTIYVKDVTDYATLGSNILASDLNKIGNAVNSNSANFASEYSPSATYAVSAYCTYQNVLYKCTTAITAPEAWTSAHWAAVKSMDEMKNKFVNITSKATCYYSIPNFEVLIATNLVSIYIPNVRLQALANGNPILKVAGISFPNYSINTFIRGYNGELYQIYLRLSSDTMYLDGIYNITAKDWVTASTIDAWLNLNLIINI